jgi:hypothetical protein
MVAGNGMRVRVRPAPDGDAEELAELGGDVLRLSGVSSEQQDRVIDGWLARHAPGV